MLLRKAVRDRFRRPICKEAFSSLSLLIEENEARQTANPSLQLLNETGSHSEVLDLNQTAALSLFDFIYWPQHRAQGANSRSHRSIRFRSNFESRRFLRSFPRKRESSMLGSGSRFRGDARTVTRFDSSGLRSTRTGTPTDYRTRAAQFRR